MISKKLYHEKMKVDTTEQAEDPRDVGSSQNSIGLNPLNVELLILLNKGFCFSSFNLLAIGTELNIVDNLIFKGFNWQFIIKPLITI